MCSSVGQISASFGDLSSRCLYMGFHMLLCVLAFVEAFGLQMVGPILLEEAQALPADLSKFLDQGVSGGMGAVYVSMGTLVRLGEDEVLSMAAALTALRHPVLWKLDRALLPGGLSQNVVRRAGVLASTVPNLVSLALCTDILLASEGGSDLYLVL